MSNVNKNPNPVDVDTSKVNRIEVIDETGRAYVKGKIYGTPVKVKLSIQDDGQTLKVFVEEQGTDKIVYRNISKPINDQRCADGLGELRSN